MAGPRGKGTEQCWYTEETDFHMGEEEGGQFTPPPPLMGHGTERGERSLHGSASGGVTVSV